MNTLRDNPNFRQRLFRAATIPSLGALGLSCCAGPSQLSDATARLCGEPTSNETVEFVETEAGKFTVYYEPKGSGNVRVGILVDLPSERDTGAAALQIAQQIDPVGFDYDPDDISYRDREFYGYPELNQAGECITLRPDANS